MADSGFNMWLANTSGSVSNKALSNLAFHVSHARPMGNVRFYNRFDAATLAKLYIETLARTQAKEFLDSYIYKETVQRRFEELKSQHSQRNESNKNRFYQIIKDYNKMGDNDEGVVIRNNEGKDDNKTKIVVRDYMGRPVPEALVMSYYDPDVKITYNFTGVKNFKYTQEERNVWKQVFGGRAKTIVEEEDAVSETSIKDSHHVLHMDLYPQVQCSTNKNLVLTQVQGRDFTRKELISGGDLNFSITGNVVGNLPGVYPKDEVERLIKLAQYKGIVQVYHHIFERFGVKQVIIQDFNLNSQEYLNIQPYTMNCVAVETPDRVLEQTTTVGRINDLFRPQTTDQWYDIILENQMYKNAAESLVSGALEAIEWGAGAAIDKIGEAIE